MSKLKAIWNDPVWSKVISAGILALIALGGTYFLNWWPAIGSSFSAGLTYVLARSSFPNWLLGLLGLLAVPTVLLAGVLAWQVFFPPQSKQPWIAYTSDIFYNLRWRWHYNRDASMSRLITFCPHCDFQVFPANASGYAFIDRIFFRCESCARDLGVFDESYESLESKAESFAQQKLRNGSWQGGT
jgi:hypothetical protein